MLRRTNLKAKSPADIATACRINSRNIQVLPIDNFMSLFMIGS